MPVRRGGEDDRSEFGGAGVMPNTVYSKGADALTAADKLRLQSLTGQEDDAHAPVDPFFWYGGVAPDEGAGPLFDETRLLDDPARYKET